MDAFEIIRKTMNEFAEVSDDTIRAFISLAEPLISKKRFRKLYPQALAYLAAHKPLDYLLFRKVRHRCPFPIIRQETLRRIQNLD